MTAEYEVTKKLHSTMDAKVWAEEWLKVASLLRRDQILDEGWMIGWFANAIMVGYDHGYGKGRDDEANDMPTEGIT